MIVSAIGPIMHLDNLVPCCVPRLLLKALLSVHLSYDGQLEHLNKLFLSDVSDAHCTDRGKMYPCYTIYNLLRKRNNDFNYHIVCLCKFFNAMI